MNHSTFNYVTASGTRKSSVYSKGIIQINIKKIPLITISNNQYKKQVKNIRLYAGN